MTTLKFHGTYLLSEVEKAVLKSTNGPSSHLQVTDVTSWDEVPSEGPAVGAKELLGLENGSDGHKNSATGWLPLAAQGGLRKENDKIRALTSQLKTQSKN